MLGEFGTRTSTARHGGTGAGPAAQPDPGARPRSTTRRSGRPTSTSPTTTNLLFDDSAGATRWRTSTRSSRRAATGQRRGDGLGKVPYNEARYGNNSCGGIVCATRLAVRQRVGRCLVERPCRRAGSNAKLAREVRRLGSLRLRRRRQLQRARRLHRPLPVDPRRRRRRDRRRRPGHRRHLEPSLVRLLPRIAARP